MKNHAMTGMNNIHLVCKHPKRLQTLKAQWQAWSDAKPESEDVPSQPYLDP